MLLCGCSQLPALCPALLHGLRDALAALGADLALAGRGLGGGFGILASLGAATALDLHGGAREQFACLLKF